ncbi:MAG TPA: bacillithiol biosynthesis BshC, partial [Longimicrobiales bacterium]|nr:bacillithiol biosynthesis BshC [Longimicrobiales bacterium]
MNLEMIVGRPSGSALVDDYLNGRGRARSFFPWDWTDAGSYRARAREVQERFDRAARERVASMLRAPGESGRRALERWIEDGGFMVTTGQQPGLFTGPLYTIYKALTAVRLAQRLEEVLRAPVLPVFWVASEDHDWDEAHDTWIVGVDNELHRVALPPPSEADRNRPLHRVTARLDAALTPFLEHLPETDFSASGVEVLRACWGNGRTNLPEAFRCTLESLLGPSGLLFVDAHEPRL